MNHLDKLQNFTTRLNCAKNLSEYFQIKSEINALKNKNINRDISFILDYNKNRLKYEREIKKLNKC